MGFDLCHSVFASEKQTSQEDTQMPQAMEQSEKKVCPKYLLVHSFGYGYRAFATLKEAKKYYRGQNGKRGDYSTFLVKVRRAK